MTTDTHHPCRRPRAGKATTALAALTLAVALAACGSSSSGTNGPPTAPYSPSVSPTPSAGATAFFGSPSASPTSAPSPTDVPVLAPIPVSRLAPAATATSIHLDAETAAALQKALDGARIKQRVPGMQAAVAFPDGSIWTGESGAAVRSPSRKVTADTLFSVGSISKTFVAALTLRLAERGTIGLEDPLSLYLPTFPNAAHITVRQLLSHTSGVQDLFKAPGMASAILAAPNRIWTADEVLARIGKPYFAPGKGWRYSNTNYVLLGVVIEKATNETLAALVRKEFLEPLRLDHTYYQPQEQASGSGAHGYKGTASSARDVSVGAVMLPFNAEASACGPAGAFSSTAGDIARWGSALYGGAVLDDSSLAAMVDPSVSAPFRPKTPYGLGFEQRPLSGRSTWGHLGVLDGFTASMKYLPDLRITVVVLANGSWASPTSASAALVSAALAAH